MKEVRCPVCRRPTRWHDNPYRPFCSERCRLQDLGNWLGERYRIPGPPAARPPDDSQTDGEDGAP